MTRRDALRALGKSSYTPCRTVRILDREWYLVTMQNVHRDARADLVELADGETTALLPGKAAREARDASLNHCNAIRRYTGSIFEVVYHPYGGDETSLGYYPTMVLATKASAQIQQKRESYIISLQREAERMEQKSRETLAEARRRYPSISKETHRERQQLYRQAAQDLQKAHPSWNVHIRPIQ